MTITKIATTSQAQQPGRAAVAGECWPCSPPSL
jgi:hypothetical protein